MIERDVLRQDIKNQVEEFLKSGSKGIEKVPNGATGLDSLYGVSRKSKQNFIAASKRGSDASKRFRA